MVRRQGLTRVAATPGSTRWPWPPEPVTYGETRLLERREITRGKGGDTEYRPLGFHATLSYLESKAGRFQSDEAALLGALDVIEASRAVLRVELQAYAARRREAKRQGRECLNAGDVLMEEERGLLGARLTELEQRLPTWDLLQVVRHIEVASGLR